MGCAPSSNHQIPPQIAPAAAITANNTNNTDNTISVQPSQKDNTNTQSNNTNAPVPVQSEVVPVSDVSTQWFSAKLIESSPLNSSAKLLKFESVNFSSKKKYIGINKSKIKTRLMNLNMK